MSGSDLETRLTHLARTCMALRWELKSILGDGDRLPADLAIALQLLDGKAEISSMGLKRHLGARAEAMAPLENGGDAGRVPPPPATVANVVDRISRL